MSKTKEPEVKSLFQDEPLEDRAQLLEDNCKTTQTMPVRMEFTPKEIAKFKERHIELSMVLDVEDTKKQEFNAEYNAKTKLPKAENKELISNIRKGFKDEEVVVFLMDNQDDGIMEYYDETGRCVFERSLMPVERQTNLHTIPKEGTNDK